MRYKSGTFPLVLLIVEPQPASLPQSSPQSPHPQNGSCGGHFGAVLQQLKLEAWFPEQSNPASVVDLLLPSRHFSPYLQASEWFGWDVGELNPSLSDQALFTDSPGYLFAW